MSPLRIAIVVAATVAVLAALAVGCSDDNPTGPGAIYSSIVITGPDSVVIGQTAAFTATVLDTAGQPVVSPDIAWNSSVVGIATINSAGTARGVSEGDVSITASGGGATSNTRTLSSYPGYGWLDQSAALPSLRNLKGVFFIDGREGWAVGDLGAIFHTTDAGLHWSAQQSNSTGYTLNAVYFTNPDRGIVVGNAGRVLRTINGGTTWTALTVESDNGKGLNKVYFQDELRGWIVGNAGLILRTTNGGASWTRVLPAVTVADLQDVSFAKTGGLPSPPADPFGRGWAVGAAGTILASDDFGVSWRVYVPFVVTDPLFGVARHAVGSAIAVGANNRTLFTEASADTFVWNLGTPPTPFSNLNAVVFPEPIAVPLMGPGVRTFGGPTGFAWAVGKRTDSDLPVVLYSEDGGLTWVAQALPSIAPLTGNTLEDVYFVDERRAWAVGSQGLILHTVNGGR